MKLPSPEPVNTATVAAHRQHYYLKKKKKLLKKQNKNKQKKNTMDLFSSCNVLKQ